MRSKIFIRVDGDAKIGLGHLIRTSALAHILRNDFDITFYCMFIPISREKEFVEDGFEVVRIDNDSQFLAHLDQSSIAILDGYHFTTDLQREIKSKGSHLVCIDDIRDKKIEFFADIIISHGPGTSSDYFNAQEYTKFALGLDYVLIRPLFQEQINKQREIKKLEVLLICFGASDPLNLTQKTLNYVCPIKTLNKIIVITGSEYKLTNSFFEQIRSDTRIDHRHAQNEKQMLDAIIESELAIVPASGILLETLSVGTPAITGYYVSDQENPAQYFDNMNLAINIGSFRDDYKHNLTKVINGMTLKSAREMIRSQKKSISESKKNLRELFINLIN